MQLTYSEVDIKFILFNFIACIFELKNILQVNYGAQISKCDFSQKNGVKSQNV